MCTIQRTHGHGAARASRVATIVLAVLAMLAAGNRCSAQTVWTAETSDWFTPGNWTLGVPNAASGTTFDAIIADGGTAQLSAPGGSVRRLRVGLVSGPGGFLVDGGNLVVTENLHLNEGSSGLAAVIVQGAGTVTSPSTIVGHSSAFNTSFLISDPGTVYNATTAFIVGQSGASVASLTVGNGAVLASGTSTLGSLAGSTGTATVTGIGSRWSASGAFTVGNAGAGTLNILDQGVVSVGTTLSIGGTSNVNLNGGTLRFDTATGLNRINYTSGTIQLPATGFNAAPVTTLFGATPTITTGKSLNIEKLAVLFSGSSVVVNGGQLRMASLSTSSNSFLSIASGRADIGDADFVSRGFITVSGPNSSLHVNGSVTVETTTGFNTGNSILAINNDASVFIAGDLRINHVGFNFPPTAAINLNGGTLRFKDYIKVVNALGAKFNYTAGTIQLSGDRDLGTDTTIPQLFGTTPTIDAGKGLTIEGTARLTTAPVTLSGGTLAAGTLAVMPGGRLQTTQASQAVGLFVALAGSAIDATGGSLVVGHVSKVNGFYGNGTLLTGANILTLADANDAVLGSASLATLGNAAGPGTLAAANGLTLDFGGNITGFGAVDTPNNAATPLINNGHITGNSVAEPLTLTGFVKGVGTLDNVKITGTLTPGLSPTILIAGNVAFSRTSTLVMELGGATPGSGYDRIESAGALAFGGTLQATLINGFTPSACQSFNLFDWGSASGTFDALSLPALAGGLAWNTSQLYTTGVLTIGCADDSDLNADTFDEVTTSQDVRHIERQERVSSVESV